MRDEKSERRRTKFCQNCGTEVNLNAEACPNCGYRFNKNFMDSNIDSEEFQRAYSDMYASSVKTALKYTLPIIIGVIAFTLLLIWIILPNMF